MPSCCAATEPSTATGSRAVPALSQSPRARPVPSTDSRFRLVARTSRPPVLADRDHRAPVDLLVLHQGGVCHPLDVVQERDPRRRFAGQLRRPAGEALSGLDGQQVRAEPVDLREQPGLRGGGQPEDRRRSLPFRSRSRARTARRAAAGRAARRSPPAARPSAAVVRPWRSSPRCFAASETTWPSSTRIWRGS